MSRFMLKGLAVGLAVTLAGTAAIAAPTCLTFAGLEHCPVAGASLAITNGQLVVTSANGHGGVSISTPGATEWRGETRIETANRVGDMHRALSIANDVVTSSTEALHTANGQRLTSTFTASANPTYTTSIYRDGQLQGSQSKIASAAQGATVLGWILKWPSGEPEFAVEPGGRCTWVYRSVQAADLPIRLPDGRTLIGDEIRMTEDVNPQGAYPYLTFDKIVFEGDFIRVRFLSESVQ